MTVTVLSFLRMLTENNGFVRFDSIPNRKNSKIAIASSVALSEGLARLAKRKINKTTVDVFLITAKGKRIIAK